MMSKWSPMITTTLWIFCTTIYSSEVDFRYHNTEQLENFLKDVVRQYPQLTNLYSVGQSVQGMYCYYFKQWYSVSKSEFSFKRQPLRGLQVLKTFTAFNYSVTKLLTLFRAQDKFTYSISITHHTEFLHIRKGPIHNLHICLSLTRVRWVTG